MSSITSSAVSAVRSIIYLGMDVHKESITIAVLPMGAKSPTRLDRLPNDLPKLRKWLERVGRDGEIRACYEASGAGYVIHRSMKEWGYECEVIAPSLIPKRPGVQRKTRYEGCRRPCPFLSSGGTHHGADSERE